MHIWLVCIPFDSETLSDDSFERAQQLLDGHGRDRLARFRLKEDQWRHVIGRLLPLAVLSDVGVKGDVTLATTPTGKPYIASPSCRIAFNISHDASYVGIAFETDCDPSETNIGIDLMEAKLPFGETLQSFSTTLTDQLTTKETHDVHANYFDTRGTLRLFKYWTLKEAYTKAIGHGLGFDFKRLEISIGADEQPTCINLDGKPLLGWAFWGFTWTDKTADYVGVVCLQVGGDAESTITWVPVDDIEGQNIDNVSLEDVIKRAENQRG